MRVFESASPKQIDVALTILRVITGIIFTAHGAQKIFVYGFDGVAGGFAQMGIPMAALAAPAVALVEFFGGLALIAGLFTRLASLGLGVTMLGAFFFAHMKAGFFLPNGYEFVLTLFAIVTTFVITGAGSYSLDAVIAGRRLATHRVGGVLRAN